MKGNVSTKQVESHCFSILSKTSFAIQLQAYVQNEKNYPNGKYENIWRKESVRKCMLQIHTERKDDIA